MSSPLLATKLRVPKPRRGLVGRPRLLGRLDRTLDAKLMLVSAPAGFGKTTLLAEWLAASAADDRSVAWLSIDRTDNEPAIFWSRVILAVQAAMPAFGPALNAMLQSAPPAEAFLTSLLNELGGLAGAVDLVLDDYHLIDAPAIEAGMAFVVEHLPPQIRLVVSTRADPALPLARLRAQGELVEIRSADLRFSGEEAAHYLNGVMGLGLTAADIGSLEGRTEGWIAALQLAALSMQRRHDVAGFIRGFAGNDRYIVDYLVEEVLRRQPAEVQIFLLHTCFLDRLSGSLCDAVTGGQGGRAMLEALERDNLFVVPLDDRREWFRYHHLFADVLLTHFADDLRQQLPVLHRRASDWYQEHGERAEAIDHALAARDFPRAAELIELAIPELSRTRSEATLARWLKALPDDLVRQHPALGIGLVGVLVSGGEFGGVEGRLQDVERALARSGTATGDLAPLPGQIEMYRAALAQVRGDLPATIDHARRALDLAPADDHFGRAGAAGFLGIACWTAGDLDGALRSWTACRDGLRRAGRIADVQGSSIAIASITIEQGHLRDAAQIYEQALQLAHEAGGVRGAADMHAGLADLCRERNDLPAASRHLQQSQELGALAGLPQHQHRWRIVAAHLRRAEGDPAGALALLEEAQRLYVSDFFPDIRPIAAIEARVRIAQGQLDEALRWQRQSGVTVDDEPSYLRTFEHITLARLLVAQRDDRAFDFLARLLQAAERGGRTGSVIEILMLQSLALRTPTAAMGPLERALTLAAPEGYARLFLDEGEPMAALLKTAVRQGIAPAYARRLLAALGPAEREAVAMHPDLLEPLSERELDVLRLLRSDMDGPDIARELRVSLNTMRTHTKNIYEKLDVNSRRAAVRRADELNLLRSR